MGVWYVVVEVERDSFLIESGIEDRVGGEVFVVYGLCLCMWF